MNMLRATRVSTEPAFREGADLRKLATEVNQLRSIVTNLQAGTASRTVETSSEEDVVGSVTVLETIQNVNRLIKFRAARSRYFPSDLFADPAWDILLDLYVAQLRQVRTPISAVCVGSQVPATTALRWIKVLEGKGMVTRVADPFDGRRVFLSLSRDTFEAMHQFLKDAGLAS